MDFKDSPEDAAWRRRYGRGSTRTRRSSRKARRPSPTSSVRTTRTRTRSSTQSKAWQKKLYEAGYAAITWPKAVRRPGRLADAVVHLRPGDVEVRRPGRCVHDRPRDDRSDDHVARHARSRRSASCRRCSRAPRSGASCGASRTPDRTSHRSRRARNATRRPATGSSTDRRSGRPARSSRSGASSSRAPISKRRSTAGSRASSSTWRTRASRSGRSGRSTAPPDFNEVFFTDVRIPDDQRVGDVNDGWRVALTTLMNERFAIGVGGGSGGIAHASVPAREEDARATAGPRSTTARSVRSSRRRTSTDELLALTGYRSLTKIAKGGIPGPEGSAMKLVGTRLCVRTRGHRVQDPRACPALLRRRGAGRRSLGERMALGARHPPRRRDRRDHEEHHRRARARASEGAAGRQGRPVPRREGEGPAALVGARAEPSPVGFVVGPQAIPMCANSRSA